MPHLHAAPAPSNSRSAEGCRHHEHQDSTMTTMATSSSVADDSLADDMPIQFATKGYFGASDPAVLALASKSNNSDSASHAVISSFDSTSTDSSNINSAATSSSPPHPSNKNGHSPTTNNASSKSMISPSPPKLTVAGARIATDESSVGDNNDGSGTDGHVQGHEGPALTIYGSPRWTHSPIQVQRRVVSEEDEERPGEYDGWKTTGTRNKYGYQYNYGRHNPTNLRYAQVPPEYDHDGSNAPLRPTGPFSFSSPAPSEIPTTTTTTTTGDKNKRPADEDDGVPIENEVSPQPKKAKSEVVESESQSGHPDHDTEEDNRKDTRSSNGTERTAATSSKRASPPGHDHPYPQSQYSHPPPRPHQQHGSTCDERYHHQHHHHPHHPGSYRSADPAYQDDPRSDPHRHRNHYGHHNYHHNLHRDPTYRTYTGPPPRQLSRSSSMPNRQNHHHYYPYHWVEDHHGYQPVGGPPPGPGVGSGHPPSYPPSYHQHRRHGGPHGAGGYEPTFHSTYPQSHGHGRRHPTSTNRCVKLEEPIPPKSAWTDVGKAVEVVLPDFHRLVNYPDYLTKGGRHNPSPDGSGENGTANTEGRRNCVMCGKLRICSAASLMQNQRGRHVALKSTEIGSGSSGDDSTDEKDDGTAHIIPKQNKGLCTACDVTIWVMTSNGMEIKWCKGCKNFRPWAGFGEKGLATKCVRCRDRQREKYRSAKK
mmetsp:Transcript_31288/g.75679  ORF Transcript_31288/g.75679 Transcript_31288/m.75679 type:complete len:705 (-) Transcript_31288:123-2237(-)